MKSKGIRSPHRFPILGAGMVALGLASGCATVTKGANQTVTIDTRPPGAECALTRAGQKIAIVNPTPGAITIEKSKDDVSVACRKDGFQEAVGMLGSTFQAMTLGNILIGGIVGVVIDAASGAMHEYPPLVTITLVPEEFATAQERDAFFDRMKQDVEREAGEAAERINRQCSGSQMECNNRLKEVQTMKETRLAELEKRRTSARVRSAPS